jgi:hypothetical protein
MIGQGRVLLLAGTEEDLATLPEGCWIGGTSGYFITPEGGLGAAAGLVFYTDFTSIAQGASWRSFDSGDIHQLARYYPDHGFAILLLPGFSQLLGEVAGRIMEFDGLYNLPLMGWVSAVLLESQPHILPPGATPKVFAGGKAGGSECAAVLYVSLPEQYFAQLHIANLFAPGNGPEIRFPQPGQFSNGDCLIGGSRGNLVQYIAEHGIDPRLPLVADHEGALLNVSILVAEPGRVIFLAPVSPALTYRFAEDVLDYAAEFARAAEEIELDQAAHACICALHYYHAGLTYGFGDPPYKPPLPGPHITAPVTFGQIAYTVLNQTLTCLTIGRNEEELEDFAP